MVNPSPYMTYMQTRGSILVASSPEILCRVGLDGLVTNRYCSCYLTCPPAGCSLPRHLSCTLPCSLGDE